MWGGTELRNNTRDADAIHNAVDNVGSVQEVTRLPVTESLLGTRHSQQRSTQERFGYSADRFASKGVFRSKTMSTLPYRNHRRPGGELECRNPEGDGVECGDAGNACTSESGKPLDCRLQSASDKHGLSKNVGWLL